MPSCVELYSKQLYFIRFVCDLQQRLWFSPATLVSTTNKIRWVICSLMLNNFSAVSWREQVNEMMMRSALSQTNTLSWIFIVLAHRNNSPQIDMSPHSDALAWFRDNQYLLFLLSLARSNKYQFYSILVLPNQGLNPRHTALMWF